MGHAQTHARHQILSRGFVRRETLLERGSHTEGLCNLVARGEKAKVDK